MSPSSSKEVSTNTLTEIWLRALGWHVDQCERRIGSRTTKDLFGFADQFAFAGRFRLLVQTTTGYKGGSGGHLADRRRKVLASENALAWKQAHHDNLIFLLGWRDGTGEKPPRLEEVQLDRDKLVSVEAKDACSVADVRDF